MIPSQHIHPMLIHFPIVLAYALVVLDLAAHARQKPLTVRSELATVSTFLAFAAGLFAVATWYYGGVALDFAEARGFHSDIAETHEALGGATAFVFLAWGVIRLILWVRDRSLGRFSVAIPLIEVACVVLVTMTASYGGRLVYDLGVNVAQPPA